MTNFLFKDALPDQGGTGLMTSLLSFVLGAFFIYSISKRKNWARIVMAVLAGLTTLVMLFGLGKIFSISPILGVLIILGFILNIAGLVMLFSPEANAWFKSQTTNPPTQF